MGPNSNGDVTMTQKSCSLPWPRTVVINQGSEHWYIVSVKENKSASSGMRYERNALSNCVTDTNQHQKFR